VVTLQPLATTREPQVASPCSSRCWSASSPRPSGPCCRPSASPAWTGSCSATCWRCPAAPSRRPATSTLLLDKTGTITYGNRQASEFMPGRRRDRAELAGRRTCPPRRRDARGPLDRRTRSGRVRDAGRATYGVVADATVRRAGRRSCRSPPRPACRGSTCPTAPSVRKGAGTRSSRVGARRPAAGARGARRRWSRSISSAGGTPLVVAEHATGRSAATVRRCSASSTSRTSSSPACASGSTSCADGHPHRDDHRRQPADRQAIAEEAGVDDFLAEATPEDKMALIKKEQEGGNGSSR
jgi:K+-transporting ATPase ATPase B chain